MYQDLEIIPQSVPKMSWYVNLITPAFRDRNIRGCITVLRLRSSWRAMQSSHVTDRSGKRYLSRDTRRMDEDSRMGGIFVVDQQSIRHTVNVE